MKTTTIRDPVGLLDGARVREGMTRRPDLSTTGRWADVRQVTVEHVDHVVGGDRRVTVHAAGWGNGEGFELHVRAGEDAWRVEVSWTLAEVVGEVMRRIGGEVGR